MHTFLFYNNFIIFLYLFRALCAHHQGLKIVLYSICYHHTCRWPSREPDRHLRCDDNRLGKCKVIPLQAGVAQRLGRVIALLFHDRGTRRGWVALFRVMVIIYTHCFNVKKHNNLFSKFIMTYVCIWCTFTFQYGDR